LRLKSVRTLLECASTMKMADCEVCAVAALGSISMLTEPDFEVTERRLLSVYKPLIEPEIVSRYVSREVKPAASRELFVKEMRVAFVTEKSTPGWICVPKWVEAMLRLERDTPAEMYTTRDMPRQAIPCGIADD
jgi:hypothetical protein